MDGFVLINKPSGVASFKVTSAVKRKSGVRRCGHAGTLDPIASGVLPVMIGRATRLIDLIPCERKTYVAQLVFGLTTDTLDCEGEVLCDQPVCVTEDKINSVLSSFRGEIMQVPPMYSALKRDGKKLYELARQGIVVERTPRKITIFSIKLLSFDGVDTAQIEVCCSKGTYIRTLIDDIGKKLGCGAFMSRLCRTQSNGFSIDECVSLWDFENEDIEKFLLSPDVAVKDFPQVSVTQSQAIRFSNGGELDKKRLKISDNSVYFRVYSENKFLGTGELVNETLKPKCVF